jgi:predicted aspartyl protease
MNSRDVIEAGRAIGLEYQKPLPIRALLDTGASVTVISKKFADYCKLFQTNEGSEITAIGATHRCGEHAGSISFPGTDLRSFDPIRIVSAVFAKERHYACLIGRDILRNWVIVFDGRSKRVTITD